MHDPVVQEPDRIDLRTLLLLAAITTAIFTAAVLLVAAAIPGDLYGRVAQTPAPSGTINELEVTDFRAPGRGLVHRREQAERLERFERVDGEHAALPIELGIDLWLEREGAR